MSKVRNLLCMLGLMGVAACGSGSEPQDDPTPPPGPPEPSRYVVSGVVRDSLSGGAIAGATVTYAGSSTTSSAAGYFEIEADEGAGPVQVTAGPFEAWSGTVTLDRDRTIAPQLRRLAPYLKAFGLASGQATVHVVDLQGAATIDQTNSNVFYGATVQYLGAWPGTPLDPVTSRITFPVTGTPTTFNFYLQDAGGRVGHFACTPPAMCTEVP